MDAIMVTVVAVLLANSDGRNGKFLSDLLQRRPDKTRVTFLYFAAFGLNALVSALGGTVADKLVGQGVLQLLLAFALGTAAATLLWPYHGGATAERLATARAPMLALHMAQNQFGDRNQFLIGAFAATAGAGLWAAAGGAAGWTLALVPVMAMGAAPFRHSALRWLRWSAAAALAVWAAIALRAAFGV